MKTQHMRQAVRPWAFVVLAVLALSVAAPAGAQFVQAYLARTFTSTATSGVNAFVLKNAGARLVMGPTTGPYLTSDGGSTIITAANVRTSAVQVGGSSASFFDGAAMRFAGSTALATCASGTEGSIYRQTATGGTSTGAQTRWCACVSDGAASPTYSWRNLISGTAGNATTCNP